MDPPQQALALEGRQVPADRLGGDVELVGEGCHVNPAVHASPLNDELQPFLCIHVRFSPFSSVFICIYACLPVFVKVRFGNGGLRPRFATEGSDRVAFRTERGFESQIVPKSPDTALFGANISRAAPNPPAGRPKSWSGRSAPGDD